MKKICIFALATLLCSGCDTEDEDFAPYPGGKSVMNVLQRLRQSL